MNDVILNMPFLFTVRYKPFRAVNERRRLARETMPVSYPSLSDEDAPVAIEWVQNDSFEEYGGKIGQMEPSISRLRLHDGRLFAPVGGGVGLSVEDFSMALSNRRHRYLRTEGPKLSSYEYPVMPALENRDRGQVVPTDAMTWEETIAFCKDERSRIVGNDQEEMRERSAAILADAFIVVDGKVWTSVKAHEPRYQIANGAVPKLDVVLNPQPLAYCADFRADRFDDVEACMKNMGLDLSTKDEIRILIPEALTLDHVVLMGRQATACLHYDSGRHDPDWPLEATYLVDRIRRIRNEGNIDLKASVEILDSYARLVPLLGELQKETDAGRMMHLVAPILWRWQEIELPRRPDLADLLQDVRDEEEALSGLSI